MQTLHLDCNFFKNPFWTKTIPMLKITVWYFLSKSMTSSKYADATLLSLLFLFFQGVGMANKGPSYGMSRQVQDKIDSKYDPELEQILVEWISRQCGSAVGRPEAGKLGFQAWLKDGCVSLLTPFYRLLPADPS